jgi:hypothetical protein
MEAVMTDEQTTITAESEGSTWQGLIDAMKAPLTFRYSEGPWSSAYFPPLSHRSTTFTFEHLSARVREIDEIAYLSSAEHIRRALGWGLLTPEMSTANPDLSYLDMWSEMVTLVRGETYSFAALTHERDRELGCAYLMPAEDQDDPYETSLQIWTIEEAVGRDLDIALIKEFMAWIEADWPFERVIHYVPEAYQRGHEVAAAARLRRVDREQPGPTHTHYLDDPPEYATYEWVRP